MILYFFFVSIPRKIKTLIKLFVCFFFVPCSIYSRNFPVLRDYYNHQAMTELDVEWKKELTRWLQLSFIFDDGVAIGVITIPHCDQQAAVFMALANSRTSWQRQSTRKRQFFWSWFRYFELLLNNQRARETEPRQ